MDKLKLILEKVKQFLKDSKTELRKVTWPTSKQTLASTSVVIIVVVIISVFLGVVDFGLSKIIRMALG
jgi:preprotein translocase subunit SecE